MDPEVNNLPCDEAQQPNPGKVALENLHNSNCNQLALLTKSNTSFVTGPSQVAPQRSTNTRNQKNVIWDFFKPDTDPKYAKCNRCQKKYSRGGVGKNATTTNLEIHLERIHPDDYRAFKNAKSKQQESGESSLPRGQITIQEAFNKTREWDINDQRAVSMHYAIGEMIAVDNLPFRSVEADGFRRVMKRALPNYNVSNSYTQNYKLLVWFLILIQRNLYFS